MFDNGYCGPNGSDGIYNRDPYAYAPPYYRRRRSVLARALSLAIGATLVFIAGFLCSCLTTERMEVDADAVYEEPIELVVENAREIMETYRLKPYLAVSETSVLVWALDEDEAVLVLDEGLAEFRTWTTPWTISEISYEDANVMEAMEDEEGGEPIGQETELVGETDEQGTYTVPLFGV